MKLGFLGPMVFSVGAIAFEVQAFKHFSEYNRILSVILNIVNIIISLAVIILSDRIFNGRSKQKCLKILDDENEAEDQPFDKSGIKIQYDDVNPLQIMQYKADENMKAKLERYMKN